MTQFALFGAAGAIGHSLVDALKNRDVRYRVVGRDTSKLQRAFGDDPRAEISG